ncbi:MAG: cytochrome b [Alphaproteobacteria bacterium]|nr:cytochrome b [Alphaproteobacteria bacterium]
MAVKNTNISYGSVAKAFHWGMFLILLGLVIIGYYMADLPGDTPEQLGYKTGVFDIHKSFGILILVLVILRLGWRMINPVPKMPGAVSKIEDLSARGAHMLLYLLMFVQPIFGWLLTSYDGYSVKFFGLDLPALVGKNKPVGEFFEEVHEVTAALLIIVFSLHVAAALFHHYIRKDDVLRRMSYRQEE